MSDDAPIIAQQPPFADDVTEGKTYFWCSCGRSQNQPFCDGAHKGTEHRPTVFRAAKAETVWLCGCKRTDGKPFCDGTHNSL